MRPRCQQLKRLHRPLPELMARNCRRAVVQASDDKRLSTDAFPGQPPLTLAEVLGEGS